MQAFTKVGGKQQQRRQPIAQPKGDFSSSAMPKNAHSYLLKMGREGKPDCNTFFYISPLRN